MHYANATHSTIRINFFELKETNNANEKRWYKSKMLNKSSTSVFDLIKQQNYVVKLYPKKNTSKKIVLAITGTLSFCLLKRNIKIEMILHCQLKLVATLSEGRQKEALKNPHHTLYKTQCYLAQEEQKCKFCDSSLIY